LAELPKTLNQGLAFGLFILTIVKTLTQKKREFIFRNILCVLGFFGLLNVILTPASFASMALSANPVEGGSGIRFGRVDRSLIINKEVRIRVTTDETTQYQVFQRIVNPLTNERGESLHPMAFASYALSGSNSSGTLYQQDVATLGLSDQLVYTSAPNGQGDSLTMVYTILGEHIDRSGNFGGRVIFTLRPIGAGSQKDIVLDVFAEISDQFTVTSETSANKNEITLGTRAKQDEQGYVKISYQGHVGQPLKIYQEVLEFPQDSSGDEISPSSVLVTAQGSSSGLVKDAPASTFEPMKKLIYISDAAQDSLIVNFEVNREKFDQQKAGSYHGKIRYTIEAEQAQETIDVDLVIAISPTFKIDVVFPAEGMRFGNVLPNSPPQTREVKVMVKSNLRRPYTVMQNTQYSLTNEKGDEIPAEHFRLMQEMLTDSSGKLVYPDFTPLQKGEVPIFYSDNRGSAVEFKVIYRLNAFPGIKPGNYTANIVFSLGET